MLSGTRQMSSEWCPQRYSIKLMIAPGAQSKSMNLLVDCGRGCQVIFSNSRQLVNHPLRSHSLPKKMTR